MSSFCLRMYAQFCIKRTPGLDDCKEPVALQWWSVNINRCDVTAVDETAIDRDVYMLQILSHPFRGQISINRLYLSIDIYASR